MSLKCKVSSVSATCAPRGTGMKYTVRVSRRGPQSFRVLLGPSHVDVVARKLNDGGLIIQVRMHLQSPGPA